jgi:hypothetical protein
MVWANLTLADRTCLTLALPLAPALERLGLRLCSPSRLRS